MKKRKILKVADLSKINREEIRNIGFSILVGFQSLVVGAAQITKEIDFNNPNFISSCAFCLTSAFEVDRIIRTWDFSKEISELNEARSCGDYVMNKLIFNNHNELVICDKYIKKKNYDMILEAISLSINSGMFFYFINNPNFLIINEIVLGVNACLNLLLMLRDIYYKKISNNIIKEKKLIKN